MIIRSLRWRLVMATALIIGALVAAVGVFSSVTAKVQFDRFLIAEKRQRVDLARSIVRAEAPANLTLALRRVHDETRMRAVVFDARGQVTARYPASLDDYRIRRVPGGIELVGERGGNLEALKLLTAGEPVAGAGTLFLLPPEGEGLGGERAFRVSVDRWLLAGLGLAAVLAVLVMLTIFRRVFAPVEELTQGARALASGRLDARVSVRGDDEIAALARAFNAMADALERNERARRNMVSDVAHELRTPLSNIRAQIEGVQDGVLEADERLFRSLDEDAATLAQLVDDLQQLSLAEAGQLRLDVIDVLVKELVDQATPIPPTGIRIHTDVPGDLVVRADARRLLQVLRNLLANAIRYADTRIDIRASREGERVEIRISDDGPGVPPGDAPLIFDRFYRADASRSRTTGGAGLGLAIAKQLVELHGGTIRLEGRSTFVVSL